MFTLQRYGSSSGVRRSPRPSTATVDRATERYEVRYRADEDSPPETLTRRFTLPSDVYNGLLATLMKNLPSGGSATVQIVAFTPKPRP